MNSLTPAIAMSFDLLSTHEFDPDGLDITFLNSFGKINLANPRKLQLLYK